MAHRYDDAADDAEGWEFASYTFPRESDASKFAEYVGEAFNFVRADPDYNTCTVEYFAKKVSKRSLDGAAREYGAEV